MAEGQLLVVACGGERYAVRADEVRTILPSDGAEERPEEVLELGRVFGSPGPQASRPFYLVPSVPEPSALVAVDQVVDVLDPNRVVLNPLPELTRGVAARLGITEAYSQNGNVVLVVDLVALLSSGWETTAANSRE